jgi:hypothetical protein
MKPANERNFEMFNAREYVQDALFSDLFKDCYGFRPGEFQYARWYAMSEAELKAAHDLMLDDLDIEIRREAAAHEAAAVEFEATIASLIATGAGDRETAIRWLADSHEVDGDIGYLEYQLGLLYGYIEEGRRA